MNFLNFVLANWDSILAVAAIVAVAIVCLIKQEKSIIFKMLYAMVTEAEKKYGDGTGELKLASVISAVYDKLPAVIKTVLPVKTLERWVEEVLVSAKEKWKANANIATYIAPPKEDAPTKAEPEVGEAKPEVGEVQ